MTPEQQNIAVAEWCGWKPSPEVDRFGNKYHVLEGEYRRTGDFPKSSKPLPDYTQDLNAMHEAERQLGSLIVRYRIFLDFVCKRTNQYFAEATASQRAEALLRTIGKWKD